MELTRYTADHGDSSMAYKHKYGEFVRYSDVQAQLQQQAAALLHANEALSAQAEQLADVTTDRDEWHEMANKHLDTMIELQAELNGAQACVEEAHRALSAKEEARATLERQLADVTKERDEAIQRAQDIAYALGFKRECWKAPENGKLDFVLMDAKMLRPEMAKARRRVQEIESSMGHWFDEEFLKLNAGPASEMLLKIWRKAKETAQQLTSAQATIQRLEGDIARLKEKWRVRRANLIEHYESEGERDAREMSDHLVKRSMYERELKQRLATVEGALKAAVTNLRGVLDGNDIPSMYVIDQAEKALAPAPGDE